ncbi:Ankyrin repeat-containing protein [Myxococcus fulvus]|uniref:Ankyrin repeat-containing protein n=1 Tax=Myxococcus fulvus TaxID=33 RepID=A0A511SZC7_MYXFU|nr:ankyrin repeat domain-containing protein [Myxococcus fulvus]GEN07260.1 hypothetical protein MFU01_22970 [Myxococcus fulvus]SET96839.1 Ankyrin repeat-containing protein [Myxococcus fulvus]
MPIPYVPRLHSHMFLAGPLGLWLMAHNVSSPLPDRLPEAYEDWAAKRCQGGPVPARTFKGFVLEKAPTTFEGKYPASQLVGCEIHVVRVIESRATNATMSSPPQVALAVEETLLGPSSTGPLPAVFSKSSSSNHWCGTGAREEERRRKDKPVEGPGLGERFLVLGGWNAARTWFHVSDQGRWKLTPELRTQFEEGLAELRRREPGFDTEAELLRQHDIDHQHAPALLAAVKAGDVPGAKALLARGASVIPEDLSVASPLFFAIHHDHAEMTRLVLAATPPGVPDEGAMDEAILKGNADLVQRMLAAGIRVEQRKGVNGPLHLALTEKNCEVLQVLLEHGVNPNIPGHDSKYVLDQAVHSLRGQQCVPLLLEHGARPDPKKGPGLSAPLKYLAGHRHSPQAEAAVRALVSAGARVNQVKLKTIKDDLMRAVFKELGAR